MIINASDLLELIEQSDSTVSEKIQMGFIFGCNYESRFVVESKDNGIELRFLNDCKSSQRNSFFLKEISMNQFFNNKNWDTKLHT